MSTKRVHKSGVPWAHWKSDWKALYARLVALDLIVTKPLFAPPATEAEVRSVERECGKPIPAEMRQIFREFSAHMGMSWMRRYDRGGSLPEECPLEGGFVMALAAIDFDFEHLQNLYTSMRLKGGVLARYKSAFPFYIQLDNSDGGIACIDGRPGRVGNVIVLTGGIFEEIEDSPMACDLFSYIDAVTSLALMAPRPGPDLTPYLSKGRGLDPTSKAGVRLRKAFGLAG